MPVDTTDTAWFRLDRTHGDYAAIELKLRTRHEFFWPDNTFSETLSDAKTEGLLKMEGADADWRALETTILASAAMLQEYTREDHHLAVILLNTDPDWSNTKGQI